MRVKGCIRPSDTTANPRCNRELSSAVLVVVEDLELGCLVDPATILGRSGRQQRHCVGEVLNVWGSETPSCLVMLRFGIR